MIKDLEGKKVLVAGLGLFGGGVSTAKWLLEQGAMVTVTDLKTEKELERSLKQFTKHEREKIIFILGKHRKSDFKNCDIVVVNPGMPRESEYLKVAKDSDVHFENVASLFFAKLENSIIGITGTRGKTTTTSFVAQLLSQKYKQVEAIGGTETPLFASLGKLQKTSKIPAVVELSSWQLELLGKHAPHIALITNLYRDHQNRYGSLESYAKAKANIFKYQDRDDCLILNDENLWSGFFLKQNPKSKVFFFSKHPLAKKKEGIFISKAGTVWTRLSGKEKKLFEIEDFTKKYGVHHVENLLAAILAALLCDATVPVTKKCVMDLREVPFRQEVVVRRGGLVVVNDSAATSPDATISALSRFETAKKQNTILITGGTDKKLDYVALAQKIKRLICQENLLLLEGSGTKKLLEELANLSYFKHSPVSEFFIYKTLEDCVSVAASLARGRKDQTVVFSPAAASFEKFINEIDRGEQFNVFVKKYFAK